MNLEVWETFPNLAWKQRCSNLRENSSSASFYITHLKRSKLNTLKKQNKNKNKTKQKQKQNKTKNRVVSPPCGLSVMFCIFPGKEKFDQIKEWESLLLPNIGKAGQLAKQESKMWTFSPRKCTLKHNKGTVSQANSSKRSSKHNAELWTLFFISSSMEWWLR